MSKLQDDIYQRFHGFKPVKREYQKHRVRGIILIRVTMAIRTNAVR